MIKDGDLVAIFHSVHRVLKAEKILKDAGLAFYLLPAPRQLGADCGLAISFSPNLRHDIEKTLAAAGLVMVEVWLVQAGQYQRVD